MLILDGRRFNEAAFDSEAELEGVVIANFENLFGRSSLYLPKALIRTKDGFGTIPDGFVVDLSAGRWFLVEAELAKHSVWSHIAPQVAKQIIAARNPASRQLLIDLIVERVQNDPATMEKFAQEGIQVINIRQWLATILEDNPTVSMPINAISSDLREWASTLGVSVELWIVRKHVEDGRPEHVMYEIPELRPALDTAEEADGVERARHDVSIADLVASGLLRDGQRLLMYWRPTRGDRREFEGFVRAGGVIEELGEPFTSPSKAAVHALKSAGSPRSTSRNGWLTWRTESGESLSSLRDKYRRSHNGQDEEAETSAAPDPTGT